MEEYTTKELKEYAEQNNIDLQGAKKKADILAAIEKSKEDKQMNEEMLGQEVAEDVPAEVEAVQYKLDDGTDCSRSAYIRQEFQKDRSRQDIGKELGLKYYIVYSATANMFNAAHPENGGSGSAGKGSVLVPKVNADLAFVDAEGNVVETEELAATMPRAELMRELATAGVDRAKLKDYFQVPYATVYAATKEVFDNGSGEKRTRKTITHPETGEEMNRADYIRELYADGEGLTRRDIAKKLTQMTDDLVDYATVWAATKPVKAEEEVEVEATEPVEEA